jgi:hypothetical protein
MDAPASSLPRLITQRDLIAGVAAAWERQYYHRGGSGCDAQWSWTMNGDSATIYRQLAALDPATATLEQVERIVGNRSWTRLDCDGCEAEVTEAVEVADNDGDWSTTLCRACLTAALALLPATTDRLLSAAGVGDLRLALTRCVADGRGLGLTAAEAHYVLALLAENARLGAENARLGEEIGRFREERRRTIRDLVALVPRGDAGGAALWRSGILAVASWLNKLPDAARSPQQSEGGTR